MTIENNPKVSLLMPVYGVEEYIEKCARGLFEQTWQNIEYIFLNDGTPDRSIEIVRELLRDEFQSRASQVRIIDQENAGLGRTRLNALAAATGDYILFVDPDDWVELDYVESLVRTAIDQHADIAICDYIAEFPDGTSKYKQMKFTGHTGIDLVKQIHHSDVQSYMWNKLFKRELWNNRLLNCPPRQMLEDMFFVTIVAGNAKKVVWVDKVLYHYRKQRPGAITSNSWKSKRLDGAINILEVHRLTRSTISTKAAETDMVMRCAWYCLSTLQFRTLMKYPEAIEHIRKARLSRSYRSPMSKQIVMKLWCSIASLTP